jgi:phage-related protein
MPRTRVLFYMERDGTCPMLDWLDALPVRVRDKCVVRIERLEQLGHELRRPEADILRDGVYELRIGHQGANYRILYFFHGNVAVVLSHGIVKERVVPPREIDVAARRKAEFLRDPLNRTYKEPEP